MLEDGFFIGFGPMVGNILASTVAGFSEMLQALCDNLHKIDRKCSNNVHSI